MTTMSARPIRDITFGGPVQQGQGVAFTVVFQDGEKENFYCRADQLGALIAKLVTFGSLAEQRRQGTPQDKLHLSTPFGVTRISSTAITPDRKTVSIQVVTDQGFPFDLSMSVDLAKDAIAKLQGVVLAAFEPPEQDRRN